MAACLVGRGEPIYLARPPTFCTKVTNVPTYIARNMSTARTLDIVMRGYSTFKSMTLYPLTIEALINFQR